MGLCMSCPVTKAVCMCNTVVAFLPCKAVVPQTEGDGEDMLHPMVKRNSGWRAFVVSWKGYGFKHLVKYKEYESSACHVAHKLAVELEQLSLRIDAMQSKTIKTMLQEYSIKPPRLLHEARCQLFHHEADALVRTLPQPASLKRPPTDDAASSASLKKARVVDLPPTVSEPIPENAEDVTHNPALFP